MSLEQINSVDLRKLEQANKLIQEFMVENSVSLIQHDTHLSAQVSQSCYKSIENILEVLRDVSFEKGRINGLYGSER